MKEKNEFVINLRDYLMQIYKTNSHFTPGEENIEAGKIGDSYFIRPSTKEKNLTGFQFQNNYCKYPPREQKELLSKIYSYCKDKINIESKFEKERLKVKIDNIEYTIYAYIGKEYADYFGIHIYEI